MIEIKTSAELDAMREAGRVVASALTTVRAEAGIGTSLLELDQIARTVISDGGAKPSFLGYQPHFASSPFPGVICASINDVIVHGIPTSYRLTDGDLVSIDCGAYIDGWHGDSAISFVVGFVVGAARPGDRELIGTAERALAAGVGAAQVGSRMGDIAAAVGAIGRTAGYGIPADFGGHGIGRAMHEEPAVPNEGKQGRGLRLREGMVLAIEPMFISGGDDAYVVADDGWSLVTADGSRAAHAEHSVAITDDGPRILTTL